MEPGKKCRKKIREKIRETLLHYSQCRTHLNLTIFLNRKYKTQNSIVENAKIVEITNNTNKKRKLRKTHNKSEKTKIVGNGNH